MLISCSRAVTPLFNTALLALSSLHSTSLVFPIPGVFERGEDTLLSERHFVCSPCCTLSWHLSFAAWVGTRGSCNPCNFIFILPQPHLPFPAHSVHRWVISWFWEGRGGVGSSRNLYLLTWPQHCCVAGPWNISWRLYQLRCAEVNNAKKKH